MNDGQKRRLIPRLEAMEERVALSATALAIHDVPAAHVRHSPSNPVILNLDPQATGIQITSATFNKRFGLIEIGGVVTFPALNPSPNSGPLTTSINVSVTQGNPRNQNYGYTSSAPMKYISTGFTTPFTLYVTGSARFGKGTATVTITTSWNGYDSNGPAPVLPSASAIVRLTPA